MARARAGKLLLAGVLKAHRPAGRQGQMGAEVFDQHLLLAAKAAADARLDHPDLAQGQTKQRRHHAPHVERHLGAGANHQPVVLIPPRQHDVRLDRRLLHLLHRVLALEDMGGLGQCGLHVAVIDMQVVDEVALRIVNFDGVRLIMHFRRAGLHGCHRVKHGGQHLVLDLDQLQRLLQDLGRLGGDDGDAVADMAHLVVQADLVVGRRVGIALPARGIDHARHIHVGEHGMHAGQGACLGGIDTLDAGVGMGAGEQAAVKHPGSSMSSAKTARPLTSLIASTFGSGLLTTTVSGGAILTGTVFVRVWVSVPPPAPPSSGPSFSWVSPPVGHSSDSGASIMCT